MAQDLGHILKASHVGAQLDLEQLPLDPALEALENAAKWQFALAGGDDYELCFTISPEHFEQLQQYPLDTKITKIGQITAQQQLTYHYQGQDYPLQLHGYQHFA